MQFNLQLSNFDNVKKLIESRQQGILKCLEDYEIGKKEIRYIIPDKMSSFSDFSFDLALNHSFFTVSHPDLEEVLNEIKELARVAKEVRVFPLLDQNGHTSPLLGPLLLSLQQQNYGTEVKEVKYQLHPQGMLC